MAIKHEVKRQPNQSWQLQIAINQQIDTTLIIINIISTLDRHENIMMMKHIRQFCLELVLFQKLSFSIQTIYVVVVHALWGFLQLKSQLIRKAET